MAFERHTHIRIRHAATIIDHLNKCLAGILYNELYIGSTGINSIFHQFLDNGSRALNHLTGSYLIGHRIGKESDNIAHNLL